MTVTETIDLKLLNSLLVERLKVKRRPVAISYCADAPPPGYEPANVVACAIVREAEAGRRVYVDAQHHDCWVGQYHLGWLPKAQPLITEGEYLTMAQGFFTPEGARRNKAQSNSLPAGSIAALAAAPLDEVPEGVAVDTLICVTDPMHAMQIAGAASVREGTFPIGEIGMADSQQRVCHRRRRRAYAQPCRRRRYVHRHPARTLSVYHRADRELSDRPCEDARADHAIARTTG
jgi:uncharacterized protein (DUF169 family)